MKKWAWIIILQIGLAWSGCSGGDVDSLIPEVVGEDAEEIAAEFDLKPTDPETVVFPDTPATEMPLDLGGELPPAGDLESDFLAPRAGEAGFPCDNGDDCLEGFCIQTAQGPQCTVTCVEECPFDWSCAQHTPSLPDQIFICVPTEVELCSPCSANTDCWTDGVDAGQTCVAYGADGNFCGVDCGEDGECPEGFACEEGVDVTGAQVEQCKAAEGECPCSQLAIDAGAQTDCYVENEWGLCPGTRQCVAAGLEPCSAQAPAPEVCNDADDDCDGEVDEELAEKPCPVVNEYGTCAGVLLCQNGVSVCDGPEASPETCDGKDNDCDGDADEGFEDTDGDGVADCLVNDKDGDGVVDGLDNCPSHFNPGQDDFDLDTAGDACDPDDDDDQVADEDDCAPKDGDMFPGNEETCDGKDNNCNFSTDEGFDDSDFDSLKDCVDEDDDNDGTPDGLDCGPTDPAVHPDAVEICDGLDNDCNAQVDEELGTITCGKGECYHTVPSCAGGLSQACDPMEGVALEKCDGMDNDCDGLTDEDLGSSTCGVGPCFHTVQNCVDGMKQICDPKEGVELEICDGVDNDCDGPVDEGLGTASCGLGVCSHTVPNCIGGIPQTCNSMAGVGVEICDGADNDCDGEVDEELGESTCGLGICLHTAPNCVDGITQVCNHMEGFELEECDGIDNDCDGVVDDDLGWTTCGLGPCQHTVQNCVGGIPQVCDEMEGAGVEICDGKDNDCDGQVDEEMPLLACGIGPCFHTVQSCVGGVSYECDALEGAQPESCDGVDNDCDGEIDEELGAISCGVGPCFHSVPSCVGGVVQACNPFEGVEPEECDGIDNDCNGLVDEDMGLTSCGEGECFHWVEKCVEGEEQQCDPWEGALPEVCDGLDNDCDGEIDPQDTEGCVPYYVDEDGDGYGLEGSSLCLCDGVPPYLATKPGDCNDDNIVVNPGVDEDCDTGEDEDCSGDVNDGCIYPTCFAMLQNNPGAESGDYQIDTDGVGPKPPFPVECDMETEGGGWTIIHHDKEGEVYLQGCEPPGCYEVTPVYTATPTQMNDLVALSNSVKQYLLYKCKGSLIYDSSNVYGWWQNAAGAKMNYWPGGSANCNINDNVWRQDGDWVTDAADLPISSIHMGDLSPPDEEGKLTIGPLYCR